MHKSDDPLLVLHVDDNPFDLEHVKEALEDGGEFQVESTKNAKEFQAMLVKMRPDIALIDLHLSAGDDGQGAPLAKRVRQQHPDCTVVMRSSSSEAQAIATCLRLGADDFISKKTDKGELKYRLRSAAEMALLKRGKSGELHPPATAVAGATMTALAMRIANLVNRPAIRVIHVTGETGTGKEVVASLFADAAPSATPFVKLNCGAIAPTLMESELFGHKKGAFTGATQDRIGLLQEASGGFVFLDEISSLTLPAQAALLRAIDNQELKRVGDSQTRRIDIRVISATNDDLEKKVIDGSFRRDLWERLKECVVELPPLRARPDEIPDLIDYFARTMPGGPYQVSPATISVLRSVSWRQGNVRELRNCLRSMTEFSVDGRLTPMAIPDRIWQQLDGKDNKLADEDIVSPSFQITVAVDPHPNFETLTDRLLLAMIDRANETGEARSMRRLSQFLGLPKTTLGERLKRVVRKGLISAEALDQKLNRIR